MISHLSLAGVAFYDKVSNVAFTPFLVTKSCSWWKERCVTGWPTAPIWLGAHVQRQTVIIWSLFLSLFGSCRGHLWAKLWAPCLLICTATKPNFFPLSVEKELYHHGAKHITSSKDSKLLVTKFLVNPCDSLFVFRLTVSYSPWWKLEVYVLSLQ